MLLVNFDDGTSVFQVESLQSEGVNWEETILGNFQEGLAEIYRVNNEGLFEKLIESAPETWELVPKQ